MPDIADTFAVIVVPACCVPLGLNVTEPPLGATPAAVTAVAVEFAVCDPTPLFHVTSARIEYPTEETLPYKYWGITNVVPPFCKTLPPVYEFPPKPPSFTLQTILVMLAVGAADVGLFAVSVNVLPTVEDPLTEDVAPLGEENV